MANLKPVVFKKNRKQRVGKGFSLGELKEAKLGLKEALKLRIPVDTRRKTRHEENVKTLSDFSKNKMAPSASKRKTRKPKSKEEQK